MENIKIDSPAEMNMTVNASEAFPSAVLKDLRLNLFVLDNSLNRFRKSKISPNSNETVFSDYELSLIEKSALIVIHDTQPVSMSRLALYCGFTTSKTTRAVEALVKKNLAVRQIPAENRRKIYVSATETGYNLVQKNNEEHFNNFIFLTHNFTDKELKKMCECYTYILEMYSKHCGHPIDASSAPKD